MDRKEERKEGEWAREKEEEEEFPSLSWSPQDTTTTTKTGLPWLALAQDKILTHTAKVESSSSLTYSKRKPKKKTLSVVWCFEVQEFSPNQV